MAKLADKAKAKAGKQGGGGNLKTKAKSRPATSSPRIQGTSVEDIEFDESLGPVPVIKDNMPLNNPPPLPPTLTYLKKLATIPALRKDQ